jgi:hypothetical protein
METFDLCSSSEDEDHPPPPNTKEAEVILCLSSDDEGGKVEHQKKPEALPPLKPTNPPVDDSEDDCSLDIAFRFRRIPPAKSTASFQAVGVSKNQFQENEDLSDCSSTPKGLPANITKPSDTDDSSEDELEIIYRKPAATSFVARKPVPADDDDDSSDDDLLLTAALSKPLPKDELKKRKREEQEREKARQKKANAEDRKRKNIQKSFEKEQEKLEKSTKKDAAKQRAGKFANEEIAVIVEATLPVAVYEPLQDLEQKHGYKVAEHPGLYSGTVVFIRRDALKGGATSAVDAMKGGRTDGFEFLNKLVVIFADPTKFLDLLEKQDDDSDDYPKLEEYLGQLQRSWRYTWKQPSHTNPKITILLPSVKEAVDKLWHSRNAHLRATMSKSPPRDFELEDAVMWCSIQFNVDVIPLSSDAQLTDFLQKMVRALSEAPYRNQVTELECIKKIKSDLPATASPLEKAKDAWERMLQQVPQLSLARARNAIQVYPTALSLWEDYQDPKASQAQKEGAVANCLGGKSQQTKISQNLYRIMTSSDPNELM